jgi:hypothetical protein
VLLDPVLSRQSEFVGQRCSLPASADSHVSQARSTARSQGVRPRALSLTFAGLVRHAGQLTSSFGADTASQRALRVLSGRQQPRMSI